MIEFDAPTHVYRHEGRVIPSVTQILRAIENFDFVKPEILERAREFGRHAHQATDLFDRGELDEDSLDVALVPYLNGWKKCLLETGMVVTHSEQIVHNARMKYAGTLDKRATWKGTTWLVDLKSGGVPRSVGAQTSAYQMALEDKPRRRLCVQLKPDDYRLIACDKTTDFALFTSCLNIWNHLNERTNTRDLSEFA